MATRTIDHGLLVLRLGAGLMLAGHGVGKVADLLDGRFEFPDPLGIGPVPSLALAAFAEFVCALAVAFGFRTRLAAIPAAITMLVAAFVHHLHDSWSEKELAVLFAVAFIALALTGPGKFSVDAWLDRRRSTHRRLAR